MKLLLLLAVVVAIAIPGVISIPITSFSALITRSLITTEMAVAETLQETPEKMDMQTQQDDGEKMRIDWSWLYCLEHRGSLECSW